MAILVLALVGNAMQSLGNLLWLTRNAGRSAEGDLRPAITPVPNGVMERIVVLASLLARSAVNIRGVPCAAMSLVLHVLKSVHGPASTKSLAPCPVLLLAIDCPAISAVPKNFPAATSVRDFAARHVLKGTATNVPWSRTAELIYWK